MWRSVLGVIDLPRCGFIGEKEAWEVLGQY